jgi:hypothetical protein
MKKLFFLSFLAASMLAACESGDKKAEQPALTQEQISKAATDTANFTTIEWIDSINLDLGKAKEGQIIEVSYRFKNSGTKNLIIEDVSASCGCTVPEKPEKPFAPGEEGVIKAKFDSKGKVGANNKNVSVKANTSQGNYQLTFKVEIEAAK